MQVAEYEVPDRDGDGKDEIIALITTITRFTGAPAAVPARCYHQRREHETGNKQLKTYLRGPGKIPRPHSPDMVPQEIWGYLLTRYATTTTPSRNPASTAPATTPRPPSNSATLS